MYLSRFLFHLSLFFSFFVSLFEKKQRKKQYAFLFGIWLTRSLSRNSNKLFTVNHRNFRGERRKKENTGKGKFSYFSEVALYDFGNGAQEFSYKVEKYTHERLLRTAFLARD